jgi:hypothetical protein
MTTIKMQTSAAAIFSAAGRRWTGLSSLLNRSKKS